MGGREFYYTQTPVRKAIPVKVHFGFPYSNWSHRYTDIPSVILLYVIISSTNVPKHTLTDCEKQLFFGSI